MKKGKINITKLIEYIENDGAEEDFPKLREQLSQELSNHKLNRISSWLCDRAVNVYTYNQTKGNTLDVFAILYDSCFEKIIQNIGTSPDRNYLVETVLNIIEEEPDNVIEKNRLYNIIMDSFPNNFNHLLMNNIDGDKLKTDTKYLESVENIYSYIAEFNHFIRNDGDFDDERDYGWDKILEYVQIRSERDSNFIYSDFYERLMQNTCEAFSYGNDLDKRQFSIVRDYLNNVTSKKNFNLFENHGICDLLQIINCPKKQSAQLRELRRIIRRNLKVNDINVKRSLGNIRSITKKKGLNEVEVQRLFREVQKIKLAYNWNLPKKIVDRIIEECFNENSALYKKRAAYSDYINRILENFGINDIPKEMRDTKHYYYFMRRQIGMTDPSGMQTSNAVYIREGEPKEFLETLNTIFHENVHIEQEYCTKYAKEYSYTKYMILKEDLVNQTLLDYSALNYKTLFSEIEARAKACLKMLRFVFSLDGVKEKVDINRIIQNYRSESLYYISANEKRDGNSEEKLDVNRIFENLIKEKPDVLKDNSIFFIEYNADGTTRTPEELIRLMEHSNKNQKELIIKILEKNGIFKEENLYRDFIFLTNYSSKNKNMEKAVSYLVKSVFPVMLYKEYEKFDNLDDDEKRRLCEILKESRRQVKETPGSPFSVGITKKRKDGLTAMSIIETMERYIKVKDSRLFEEANQDGIERETP